MPRRLALRRWRRPAGLNHSLERNPRAAAATDTAVFTKTRMPKCCENKMFIIIVDDWTHDICFFRRTHDICRPRGHDLSTCTHARTLKVVRSGSPSTSSCTHSLGQIDRTAHGRPRGPSDREARTSTYVRTRVPPAARLAPGGRPSVRQRLLVLDEQ